MKKLVASHSSAESTDVLHYLDCGLENVFLKGGFERASTAYGEAVFIRDLDNLHRCIGQCLVVKPGPLSGAEFRFLRTELDLSQSAIGELCGRDERTVRNWETGNDAVPEPVNTIVRVIHKQRHDPNATFEGMSKTIRELQAADKKLFELKLEATADGWVKAVA